MDPACSQQIWVIPVGPKDPGSFRQGLVVGCAYSSGTLSSKKMKSRAEVPLFQSGVIVSTLA